MKISFASHWTHETDDGIMFRKFSYVISHRLLILIQFWDMLRAFCAWASETVAITGEFKFSWFRNCVATDFGQHIASPEALLIFLYNIGVHWFFISFRYFARRSFGVFCYQLTVREHTTGIRYIDDTWANCDTIEQSWDTAVGLATGWTTKGSEFKSR